LAFQEIKSEDLLQAEGDWSIFAKQWGVMPRCCIVIIDIEKKKSETIHEEKYWINEVQFRPHHNNTLSFCHEGPWHVIDARIWLINRDGSDLRCAKPREGKEQFGHEYWLKDGSKIGFMHFPRFYGKKATIRFIDPDTLDEEILMNCTDYSHCISNFDNSKIVGDGHGTNNPYIYVIDVKKKAEEILCTHGTTWNTYGHTQDSHPHPTFSPDSSFILFTSDRTGLPALYRVDLENEKQ
jgi:oligogalacturonide lyase